MGLPSECSQLQAAKPTMTCVEGKWGGRKVVRKVGMEGMGNERGEWLRSRIISGSRTKPRLSVCVMSVFKEYVLVCMYKNEWIIFC